MVECVSAGDEEEVGEGEVEASPKSKVLASCILVALRPLCLRLSGRKQGTWEERWGVCTVQGEGLCLDGWAWCVSSVLASFLACAEGRGASSLATWRARCLCGPCMWLPSSP